MNDFEEGMLNLLEKHVDAEMRGDLELTMATMTEDPQEIYEKYWL